MYAIVTLDDAFSAVVDASVARRATAGGRCEAVRHDERNHEYSVQTARGAPPGEGQRLELAKLHNVIVRTCET